ncbi:MAG: phosphatidate cytidylyltransferase, partial [Oscillospiraceae bacterium]|nr:phosphatidate cytidylyltransferase [Oscillospiraceae bacterium]
STAGCALAVAAISFLCAILDYQEQTGGRIRLYHVLLTLFAGCGVPLALSSVVALRGMAGGRYLVLLALLLSFVTDGAAYFGGVFLGKHRGIFPVSPKKSLEGYLCGLLGGALLALLFGLVVGAVEGSPLRPIPLILCGLLGALFSELGDLAFSLVKRQYNVKDFGKILPGHGGMLDRFDSLIFCGPVIFLLAYCANPMG